MLPIAGLEVGVVGFHVQRVLHLFPTAADGVLEVVPRALRGVLAAFPGAAGVGLHLVPGVVAVVALIAGQRVAEAVGRIVLGVIAAGRAIGGLIVLAERGRVGRVVQIAAVAPAIHFDVVLGPGSGVGIVAVPAAGPPVLGAALHVYRPVIIHHVHGLLGQLVLGLHTDQDVAAAHALGVQLGLFGRHTPANQRANETTDGRADARPGQPGHQRPGGQHRPKAGDGQHA